MTVRLERRYVGVVKLVRARLAHVHAVRLVGLSVFLHDTPSDTWHALKGWQRSRRTSAADALFFERLAGEKELSDSG